MTPAEGEARWQAFEKAQTEATQRPPTTYVLKGSTVDFSNPNKIAVSGKFSTSRIAMDAISVTPIPIVETTVYSLEFIPKDLNKRSVSTRTTRYQFEDHLMVEVGMSRKEVASFLEDMAKSPDKGSVLQKKCEEIADDLKIQGDEQGASQVRKLAQNIVPAQVPDELEDLFLLGKRR
jgi:hypothetical protein